MTETWRLLGSSGLHQKYVDDLPSPVLDVVDWSADRETILSQASDESLYWMPEGARSAIKERVVGDLGPLDDPKVDLGERLALPFPYQPAWVFTSEVPAHPVADYLFPSINSNDLRLRQGESKVGRTQGCLMYYRDEGDRLPSRAMQHGESSTDVWITTQRIVSRSKIEMPNDKGEVTNLQILLAPEAYLLWKDAQAIRGEFAKLTLWWASQIPLEWVSAVICGWSEPKPGTKKGFFKRILDSSLGFGGKTVRVEVRLPDGRRRRMDLFKGSSGDHEAADSFAATLRSALEASRPGCVAVETLRSREEAESGAASVYETWNVTGAVPVSFPPALAQ